MTHNHPLLACGYEPPYLDDVRLDIVTPTWARPQSLLEQAERLTPMLGPGDRWIVVDDASPKPVDVRELWMKFSKEQRTRTAGEEPGPLGGPLVYTTLAYVKEYHPAETVNRARHVGCSLARQNAWIVELDDHDVIQPDALDAIRQNIAAGYTFLFGDHRSIGPDGMIGDIQVQPEYKPFLFRDGAAHAFGVRAFPKLLYDAVGGYRWDGELGEYEGNEAPGGDYCLQLRMEKMCDGQGFARIPIPLCHAQKCPDSLTLTLGNEQMAVAEKVKRELWPAEYFQHTNVGLEGIKGA